MVYVLTLLITFHGHTTKFDLDLGLTEWRDAPRCAAIGELLREDLGDADHVVTFRCDRQEDPEVGRRSQHDLGNREEHGRVSQQSMVVARLGLPLAVGTSA